MQSPFGLVKDRAPFAYVAVGIVWLALALYVGSALLLWPVAVLLLGAGMMWYRPGERVTWAWAIAAAFLGLVMCGYQAYVALPLLSGGFGTIAGASLVVFVVLGLAHLMLGYAGNGWKQAPAK